MKKEYWLVLIIYIFMQFSSVIGVPVYPVWILVKSVITLTLILIILRKELKKLIKFGNISIKWAFLGVVLVFLSQYAAGYIERLFGINLVSENTQQLTSIISSFPMFMIVTSVLAPVTEEIIFRGILFRSLHKRINFFAAALISSFLFALVHLDPLHILRYTAIGFVLAFLYTKRKSIVSPVFTHVMMNTLIIIFQNLDDYITRGQK